jgi:hypothetical protein
MSREEPCRGENQTIWTVKLLRLGINDSCITFIISLLFILIADLQAAVDQLFLFNIYFFELTKFGQNEREINNSQIGNEVILEVFDSQKLGFQSVMGNLER